MLSVIAAVGQAEREGDAGAPARGIAKAKREGRIRGRVPTARRQADGDHPPDGRGSTLRTANMHFAGVIVGRLYQLRSQSCFAMIPLCLDCGSNVLQITGRWVAATNDIRIANKSAPFHFPKNRRLATRRRRSL